MPKVTLTFNLPDEQSGYEDTIHGVQWKSIAYETAMFLRNALKYGHEYKTADEALEAVKDYLWSACQDSGLDPWEE